MSLFTQVSMALQSLSSHPLHEAARHSRFFILHSLIDKYQNKLESHQAKLTPLCVATVNQHYDCMLLLLEAGANPSPRVDEDLRRTPLHIAVAQGWKSAMRLLILYGADLSLTDAINVTPLTLANGKALDRQLIEETSALYNDIKQYQAQANQSLEQHQPEKAASYLFKVAKCWVGVASHEAQFFMRSFYFCKALWFAKQAYELKPRVEFKIIIENLTYQISRTKPYDYRKLEVFFDESFLEDLQTNGLQLTEKTQSHPSSFSLS